MPLKNVTQKITLNIKDFTENWKKLNDQVKSGVDGIGKDFVRFTDALSGNQNQFKKWSATATAAANEFGNGFKKNLAIGMQSLVLVKGFQAISSAANEAVEVVADLDQTMALLGAKFGLSASQIDKFRARVSDVAGKTATDAKLMGAAFNELAVAIGDTGKASGALDIVAKMAAMGDKDPTHAAHFVTSTLQGAGLEVNQANIQSLAEGAATAEKYGKFSNMSGAEDAMSRIGAMNYGRLGLSGKEFGALVGAGSRVGGNSQASNDALKFLMDSAQDTKNMNLQVASLAGYQGSDGMMKNGKFDISRISGLKNMGGSGMDDNARVSQIASVYGVSREVANELLNMSKRMSEFTDTMAKAGSETDTFANMYKRSQDNILDSALQFKNQITTGFADLFDPSKGIIKSFIQGHPLDALSQVPGAARGTAHELWEHPLLAAGGLAAIAGGGSLISSIGGKLLGGSVGGLAGGVGMGKALSGMGVQPVYVVNASDIKNGGTAGLDSIKDLLGAGGGLSGVGGAAGGIAGSLLKNAGMVGLAAGAGVAIGEGINMLADHFTKETNSYGEDSNVIERAFGKLLMNKEQYELAYGVKVEVESKDPQFSARPSAQNAVRGGM